MSLKPVDNSLFSWGYRQMAGSADYALKTAQAVIKICKITFSKYQEFKEWPELSIPSALRASFNSALLNCPGVSHHRDRTIITAKVDASIGEAETGKSEPIHTDTYLNFDDCRYGLPTKKSEHIVTDPKLIEAVLHAGRGVDCAFDTGFKQDVEPIVTRDSMLICPRAKHKLVRPPLDPTFTKVATQNEKILTEMAGTAFFLLIKQLEVVLEGDFVQNLSSTPLSHSLWAWNYQMRK